MTEKLREAIDGLVDAKIQLALAQHGIGLARRPQPLGRVPPDPKEPLLEAVTQAQGALDHALEAFGRRCADPMRGRIL